MNAGEAVGTIREGRMKVTDENTALRWGSGTLPVLATPAMITLIERTASECLKTLLSDGESSVGTLLDIKHSAPSTVGSEVICVVEIIETDRSKIVFSVSVRDSAGEVGSGRHERFIVDSVKFMSKAASRAKS